jgi:alpha-mannosidase
VGEPGFGVAIANDSTYGHDVSRVQAPDGGSFTLARMSLLRGPLFPDPDADQGAHSFEFSLRPDSGIPEAVAAGYRLNLPLRALSEVDGTALGPLLRVDHPAVVVEAVKLAEDRSGDVIVRLYEAHGTRARAMLTPDFDYSAVLVTDLLERRTGELEGSSGGVEVLLRPFQIMTLRFAQSRPRPA